MLISHNEKKYKDYLDHITDLVQVLEDSEDSTGCSEDLTIVSRQAFLELVDFIVNHCEDWE